MEIDIPDIFDGTVIKRGDVNYESECYQYASSSYLVEGIIRPVAIIKAKNESDVIKAINYAKENKIAVAVRTGGHQYSGASSTNGKNIQLDLSQTYKDFHWDDEKNFTLVTFGVSFSLEDFNTTLGKKGRFVPHGQCKYVNLGGHIQTGGFGQLARSFGLLSDYVEKFRIITADGQTQWVDSSNKDLFFAVLGGSPGNFGVLTHVTLNVLRDDDHPKSRGLRALCPYSKERLMTLLDKMVGMDDNKNFPADYDYCITVMIDQPYLTTSELTYDQRFNHRETDITDLTAKQQEDGVLLIVIFIQWANLGGDLQNYNPEFINNILNVAGTNEKGDYDKKLVEVIHDHVDPTPMSELTSHWIIPIEREFNLPYIKRVYSSNSSSQTLMKNDWTDWVSDQITIGCSLELNLSAQFQYFGGDNSRFFQNTNSKLFKNGNYLTSFSWRDTSFGCTMDAFYYKPGVAEPWMQLNDLEVGYSDSRFCIYDRRVLWGSHDLDLSANWKYYYDQEDKYMRLCRIKKDYDSSAVFTPNRFCIGLSVPKDIIQPKIKLTGSKTTKEEVASVELQLRVPKDIIQPKIKLAGSKTTKEEVASVELQLRAEEKFRKMMSMKRKAGKPVCLRDIWRT